MSIIYDALKKVELSDSNEAKAGPVKSPKRKPRNYLLYALVIFAVIFIANIFYDRLFEAGPVKSKVTTRNANLSKEAKSVPSTSKNGPDNPPLERISEPVKEAVSSFTLNGVFFSGNEGYALINNRIVKEGDKIEEATVIKITLDEVELKYDSSTIKLSSNTK